MITATPTYAIKSPLAKTPITIGFSKATMI